MSAETQIRCFSLDLAAAAGLITCQDNRPSVLGCPTFLALGIRCPLHQCACLKEMPLLLFCTRTVQRRRFKSPESARSTSERPGSSALSPRAWINMSTSYPPGRTSEVHTAPERGHNHIRTCILRGLSCSSGALAPSKSVLQLASRGAGSRGSLDCFLTYCISISVMLGLTPL